MSHSVTFPLEQTAQQMEPFLRCKKCGGILSEEKVTEAFFCDLNGGIGFVECDCGEQNMVQRRPVYNYDNCS